MQVPTRRGVHRFQTGRVDLTAKRTNDVLRKPDNLTSYRQRYEKFANGERVLDESPPCTALFINAIDEPAPNIQTVVTQ